MVSVRQVHQLSEASPWQVIKVLGTAQQAHILRKAKSWPQLNESTTSVKQFHGYNQVSPWPISRQILVLSHLHGKKKLRSKVWDVIFGAVLKARFQVSFWWTDAYATFCGWDRSGPCPRACLAECVICRTPWVFVAIWRLEREELWRDRLVADAPWLAGFNLLWGWRTMFPALRWTCGKEPGRLWEISVKPVESRDIWLWIFTWAGTWNVYGADIQLSQMAEHFWRHASLLQHLYLRHNFHITHSTMAIMITQTKGITTPTILLRSSSESWVDAAGLAIDWRKETWDEKCTDIPSEQYREIQCYDNPCNK